MAVCQDRSLPTQGDDMQTIQFPTIPDLPGFVLDLRRIREPGF
jgi:hypothetical protein